MRAASVAFLTGLCLLATASPPASAGERSVAEQHLAAGRGAYADGDYVRAIEELKLADVGEDLPDVAYYLGMANERLGRRRVALRYYRRYLADSTDESRRSEVEEAIGRLEREVVSALPLAETTPAETTPAETTPQMVVVDPRWVRPTPVDPFVGGPVVHKAQHNNVLLYSIMGGLGAVVLGGAIVIAATHHSSSSSDSTWSSSTATR